MDSFLNRYSKTQKVQAVEKFPTCLTRTGVNVEPQRSVAAYPDRSGVPCCSFAVDTADYP